MVGNIYFLGNAVLSIIFIYYVFKFSMNVNRQTAKNVFFASIIYLPILLILVIVNS